MRRRKKRRRQRRSEMDVEKQFVQGKLTSLESAFSNKTQFE